MSHEPPSFPRNLRGGEPSEPLAPLPDPARSRPTGRVDGPEPHDALYDGLPVERDPELEARILAGGDPSKLPEARQRLESLERAKSDSIFEGSDSKDRRDHLRAVRDKRRRDPEWARAMDEEQAAYRSQLAARRRTRRSPRRRRVTASGLFARRRSPPASRPGSRRASRRVSPSRGDPDPGGDTEPPPPAQGRGEDAARNLRALKAAGPVGAAFAAELGHLPGHLQALALSRLDPEFEADFWREIERAAVARWEVVR